jgi:hypothetical protein
VRHRVVVSKLLVVLPLVALLAGCQALVLSIAGAGATAAVGHSLNGISHRTFTVPLPAVKHAVLAALEKMGITLESSERLEDGEMILARAGGRTVEVELEVISQRATRVRVATKNGGFFYDSATANEIIAQTQKVLETRSRRASRATPSGSAPIS